jgi:tellurite resistance protein
MIAVLIILAVLVVIASLAMLGMSPGKQAGRRPVPRPQAERALSQEEFGCRVTVSTEQSKTGQSQVFHIEIKGVINAPSDNHDARLRVTIDELSEQGTQPVKCTAARYQRNDSGVFFYEKANGRLPRQRTELADWVAVASLPVGMFMFSRKGTRKLVFRVALVSGETGQSLAAAKTQIDFENENLGHEDADTNIARTQQFGVTLALAMAIADDDVAESELTVIRNWAASKLAESNNGEFIPDAQLERQLEKALQQAIKFFSSGGRIDIRSLCSEIVELAPEAERFELLKLCISVAKADDEVTEKEMELLNRFCLWLVLDRGKVRQMFEQLITVDMSTYANHDVALGITSDMDPELIRKYLNDEYRRWNARVTNSDPVVRQKAERIMAMIAEARRKYVKEQSPSALHTLTPRHQSN